MMPKLQHVVYRGGPLDGLDENVDLALLVEAPIPNSRIQVFVPSENFYHVYLSETPWDDPVETLVMQYVRITELVPAP